MPRATRAAARAGMIHVDDPDICIDQLEPSHLERSPLREIQDNDRKLAASCVEAEIKGPKKKGKAKLKKTKIEKKDQPEIQSDMQSDTQHQERSSSDVECNDTQELSSSQLAAKRDDSNTDGMDLEPCQRS